MQMFVGKFDRIFEMEEKLRNNFDSFWGALITVLQIRNEDDNDRIEKEVNLAIPTVEDWNEVLYTGILPLAGLGLVVSVYFMVLFICGNDTLLNVFLASEYLARRERDKLFGALLWFPFAVDNLTNAENLIAAEEEE